MIEKNEEILARTIVTHNERIKQMEQRIGELSGGTRLGVSADMRQQEDIGVLTKKIDELNNRIPLLENDKKTIENTFAPLTKSALAQQPAIFQISYLKTQEVLENKRKEIADVQSRILDLENSILNLEKSIESIQPTKVVKSPSVSASVGPKILFNTLIALILGVFIGLVTAFSLEWWTKNKQSIS